MAIFLRAAVRRIPALAALFLVTAVSLAQAQQRSLVDDKGCKFFEPDLNYPIENIQWNGPCKDGYVDGPGEVIFLKRGWTFRGEFKRGEIVSGRGTRNNGSDEGQFKKGLFHGHGILTGSLVGSTANLRTKFTFEGMFAEGLYDGTGRFTTDKGYSYDGIYAKGRQSGVGKEAHPDGSFYEGAFVDGYWEGPEQHLFLDSPIMPNASYSTFAPDALTTCAMRA